MATIFIDGFDKYGAAGAQLPLPNNIIPQGGWGIGTPVTGANIVSGLSASGQAVQLGNFAAVYGNVINKTLPTNYSRLIGGVRFSSTLQAPAGVIFIDNFTPQCSVLFNPTSGLVGIYQGSYGSQLELGHGSVAAGTIHYLEWDITFNTGSMGGWTVWLDGVQILGGTGTTIQTANAYANVVQLGTITGFTDFGTSTFDDFYLFDDTTSLNNSVLLSNPSVVTQFPIGDHQTQFTNDGNVFGAYAVLTSNTYASGANTLYLAPFTPNVNCTINDVVAWTQSNNATANFKGVIYSDSTGAPHTLLSSGTQVTGCTVNTQLLMPLVTPQNLTGGVQYWLGFITDSSISMSEFNGSSVTGQRAANTYSGGAPGTAPSMTLNQATLAISGWCTGATTNWESEALNPPMGDGSSVSSATPTTEDLYIYPALPTSVVTVYTVGVSGNARLSFPGVHTFDLVALSGGTSGTGSNTGLNPTVNYAWYDSYFETDPNTGSPWTPTAVTNAFFGMEIIS